jgi:hypothetical protein
MPLQKLQFKPGVDRENTRYAAEGGWYETNKVRFRRGMPQKIGGWVRLSNATFLGVCRSMLNWVTLQGQNLVSVGTNLKYYIERGGAYFDITPIRSTVSLTDPFDTTSGSAVVLVTDTAVGLAVLGVRARGVLVVLQTPPFGFGVRLTSVRTCSLLTVAGNFSTGMRATG